MPSLQKMTIIGHVGKDAEMRYTPQGTAVTNFSVAVTETYKVGEEQRKSTIWFRVTTWGKRAETCNQYVKKGMLVQVEGKLKADDNGRPRIYTKTDGTSAADFEITAFDVLFLSRADSSPQTEQASPPDEEVPY